MSEVCEAAGHRPTYRDAATTVTASVRGAAECLGQDVDQDRQQLRDALSGWWRPARQTQKEAPPIPDYDQLTASTINEHLPRLSQAQLSSVAEYERAHANRVTVLNKIQSLLEEER